RSKGLMAVILLRLMPVAPFSIVNLAAGASHVRFRDFMAGTAIGMAPGVVLATSFARQLVAAVTHPTPLSLMLVGVIGVALVSMSLVLRRMLTRRE
ncbi:MAG TPA: VTT domain-containing protein, partial [Paraburkholderia sp.]|uniref:VTT domain-containing protein n=1 Tax=Paraburkholderia sp. TaxID=1926495 RepID=UPI002ED4C217